MREILRHPKFQALESAWRGLHFLVKRTQTSSNLKIYLCDIGKDQLSNHLKSYDNLSDSEFCNFITGYDSDSNIENNWARCLC